MRDQPALVDGDIFAVLQRLQRRRIGRGTADAEFFHLLDQRRFRVARRRLGGVLGGVDLVALERFAGADFGQAAVFLVLGVLVLLFGIGGEEAVEADDRADGAQRRACGAPFTASISTVVRSISAGCIWLAMARFQIIS